AYSCLSYDSSLSGYIF
nr:immunoglobulin light chain junction region [Macaca mulatta]